MTWEEYRNKFYEYRNRFRKLAYDKGLIKHKTPSVAKMLNQIDEGFAKQGISAASEICGTLEGIKQMLRGGQGDWVRRTDVGNMDQFAAKLTYIKGKSVEDMHPDKAGIYGVEYGDSGPFKFMVGVQPWDDIESVEKKINEASRAFRQYWIDECLDKKPQGDQALDLYDIGSPELFDYLRDASNDRVFPFDDWERIINVYQMKPNTTNAAIYKKLAINADPIPPGRYNATCTERHALRLVAGDLKQAEILINAAAANTFPYLKPT